MVKEHACPQCEKRFHDEKALRQHANAAHAMALSEAKKKPFPAKRVAGYAIAAVVVAGIIYALVWGASAYADQQTGLGAIHWHPHLRILIDGQERTIPPDIGLDGPRHNPIHTHESDGIIHLEVQNPTKEQLTLGYFFQVWGQQLSKDCLLEKCGGTVEMTVNGERNEELGAYSMAHEDEIVLSYTSP